MNVEPGQAKSIFLHAVENCSSGDWGAYLDQACGEDAELRRRVMLLLDAHQTVDSLIDTPDPKAPEGSTSFDTEQTGTVIGPYKLLQAIGEGGMGTVFMAEQIHPVRRLVALKLIKAGMDSRQVLARFGAERQALALMDHPSIAKVLDAGAAEEGRPYFVMELVKGIPITRFCDERRLTLRERLELAIPVCQAVQHAHQKGIIHRDLKPSNVLIALYDGKPVPKVIDFGVAKAAGPRLTDQTLYTEFGAVVGTLEYMSPEQAELNQLDIDTRSDIYSLGVLLYELLTGSTPLDQKRIKQVVFLEVLRLIREEESPRPSLRLATTEELPSIASCRHIEPRKLSGLVRGELDWIVMKALEKDRNRRYATANGLAADLRRYLDDEPVQACPPSLLYRCRKFGRRNLGALTTVMLLAAALIAGTVVSTWQAIQATQARKEAAQQRDLARANFQKAHQAVDTYLTEVSEDQLLDQAGLQPLRFKLLKSALAYYEAFVEERGADPALRRELAEAYRRVGSITSEIGSKNEAEAPLRQAIGLFQTLLDRTRDGEELQSGLARSYQSLAYIQTYGNQAAQAKESAERAITLLVKLRAAHPQVTEYGHRLGQSFDMIGLSLVETGEYAAGKQFHVQAVEVLSETSRQAPEDAKVKSSWGLANVHLSLAHHYMAEREAQEEALRHAIATFQEIVDKYPDNARFRNELAKGWGALGMLRYDMGHPSSAEQCFQSAALILEKLAEDNRAVLEYRNHWANTLGRLGEVKAAQGQPGRAERLFLQSIAIYQELNIKDPRNPKMLLAEGWFHYRLGCLQAQANQLNAGLHSCEKARKMQAEALALTPKSANYQSDLLWSEEQIGLMRVATGQITPAAQIAGQDRVVQERLRLVDKDPGNYQARYEAAVGYVRVAELQAQAGGPMEAQSILEKAVQILEQITHAQPENFEFQRFMASALAVRSRLQSQNGDAVSALRSAKKAVSLVEGKLVRGESHYLYDLACHQSLCSSLANPGKSGAAAAADRHAAVGVEALQRAIAAGYEDVYKLKTDSVLAPLRMRADFQKLVESLEAKVSSERK